MSGILNLKRLFSIFSFFPLLLVIFSLCFLIPQNAQCITQKQLKKLPSNIQNKVKKLSPDKQKQLNKLPSNIQDKQKQKEKKSAEDSSKNKKKQKEAKKKQSSKTTTSLSEIEKTYNSMYGGTNSTLRQFGYKLFKSSSQKIRSHIVPDKDYTLGPGDSLRVHIWGSGADREFETRIRPDGSAAMPQIGVVSLTGIKLGNVKEVLKRKFQEYIQGIKIAVSLEELRSIEVYVVGAVQEPGLHMVPAFSTPLHALLAAGGIPKYGSLRRINLVREEGKKKQIDLYNLLLQGTAPQELILEDRDVIFVPHIGPTAAVSGGVVHQGIFELKEEKNVGELLDLAGGLLPQSYTPQLNIFRYKDNKEPQILSLGTKDSSQDWKKKKILSGDMLKIGYIEMAKSDAVRLRGHVWYPTEYSFQKGMKLSDILQSKQQLKPEAITEFGLIYRYNPQTTRYTINQFPLDKLLQGKYDQPLKSRDRIVVLSRKEKGIKQKVRISGAVWQPGEYKFRPEMSVDDLISLAGGTKFGAKLSRLEVSRQHLKNGKISTEHISLSQASKRKNFTLKPLDYVFVPLAKDAQKTSTVELTGEFKFPGTYRIREGERLSDVISRAGGFTDQAYFFGAKFTSPQAKEIQRKSVDKLIRELEMRTYKAMSEETQSALSKEEAALAQQTRKNIQGFISKLKDVEVEGRIAITLADLETFAGSKYDFRLEGGDALHVPQRPNFVAVTGSVYSPSAYMYQPGRTAEYYLNKSGGPTKSADEDYIYVLRANGEVISAQQDAGFSSPLDNTQLMPGDTVVVPEDLERIPYLRMVKDITDIVFKIATTAGVALSL